MINISERLNKFIRPLGFIGFFLDTAGAIIGIFIFKTADYNNPLVIIIPASLIFNVLYFIFFKDSGEIEIFDDFERIFFLTAISVFAAIFYKRFFKLLNCGCPLL